MNTLRKILCMLDIGIGKVLILLLTVYQKVLSPDHSFWATGRTPYCRYFPTCSMYGIEAIKKHGGIRGGLLATKRVFRCHPWAKGGLDPVPDSEVNKACKCK